MNILDDKEKQLRCYQIEKNVIKHMKYEYELEKSNKEAIIEILDNQNKGFYNTIEKIKEARKSIFSCTALYNLSLLITSFVGIINFSLMDIKYLLILYPSLTLLYLGIIYKDCAYLKNNNSSYVYKLIHKNKKSIHNLHEEIKTITLELTDINDRMFECNKNIENYSYDINLYKDNKNEFLDEQKAKQKVLK